MFYTLVRTILRRGDLDMIEPAKAETTERSTEEVIEGIIRRRLYKIEALQAQFMRELGTKLRSRKATVATSQEGSSSTGVRLSSQQQLLLGKRFDIRH
jgi:hypothetical protein